MGLTIPESLEKLTTLNLRDLLEQSRPAGTLTYDAQAAWVNMTWPKEHDSHQYAVLVTAIAFLTALSGVTLAAVIYWFGYINADEVRRQFAPAYRFLINKWYFDELYDFIFVKPTLLLSRVFASIDRNIFDRFIDGLATTGKWFARRFDQVADRGLVDGSVNVFAGWMHSLGLSLRRVQTGNLRQYIMFIVVGAVAVFLLITFFWNPTLAR
jgi:NADH-quinone oxidoreductase subunit L